MSWKMNGILASRRRQCLGSCLAAHIFEHPGAAEGDSLLLLRVLFQPPSHCQRAPSASPFLDVSCLASNIPSDTIAQCPLELAESCGNSHLPLAGSIGYKEILVLFCSLELALLLFLCFAIAMIWSSVCTVFYVHTLREPGVFLNGTAFCGSTKTKQSF